MEVVIDNNVLIGAAFRKWNDYQVLQLIKDQAVVAVSMPAMIRELEFILRNNLVDEGPITRKERNFLEKIMGELVDVSDRRPRAHIDSNTIEEDHDDLPLLLAALRALPVPVPIVTHDKHLLDKDMRFSRLGVKVLQPLNFLRTLPLE